MLRNLKKKVNEIVKTMATKTTDNQDESDDSNSGRRLSVPRPLAAAQEGTPPGAHATHKAWLLVQTGFHELLEGFAVAAFQRGGVVLWDEE